MKYIKTIYLQVKPKLVVIGNAPSGWENEPVYPEARAYFKGRPLLDDVHNTEHIFHDTLTENDEECDVSMG